MNQHSVISGRPPARAPVFFWITVGLLAMLFLGGAAVALLLVFAAGNINRAGGWGWLLVAGIYVVAITVICFVCALCTAVSLFRGERYRRLSIAILIISCFVVLMFGPGLIRGANRLRQQHDQAARTSESTSGAPANSSPETANQRVVDKNSSGPAVHNVEDPQILELKSKVWAAIHAKNADAIVDCFHVEERFNTPGIRAENRTQMEILLRGETTDVEIREIPASELAGIMKIQNAKPASLVRYSLVPKMMLRIQQQAGNGRVGRSFLIGERNGKWYIITMAGHTT